MTADTRARAIDGRMVVLDIRNGDYILLNRVATAMWKALVASPDRAECLRRLQAQFAVPADRIAADLATFVRDCTDKKLLQVRPAARPSRPIRPQPTRPPTSVSAWLALLATTRALARRPFGAVYRDWANLPRPTRATLPDVWRLQAMQAAFVRAENFIPLRRAPLDCLPRSLALYRFLLRCGIPASHAIGVRRFPFEAHAWVEAGGFVMLDHAEEVRSYAVIARL